ncbi:MAG TPA: IclR family transcriptional regulator [Syntrophorhabdaceae bacterium]|nr:IclR family transcriptional regulator [Syntrophorhabdaceae bacterium]
MKKSSKGEKNDYNQMVPAVEQAAKIIIYLCSMPNLQSNLTDISRSVGISKSKAYAILNTLQKFGFISRNLSTKVYSVGLYMMSVGQKVLDNIDYGDLASPLLKGLAEATRSTAALGLIAGESQYVISRQEATGQLRISVRPDKVFPLTYGAHGKAIVCSLPQEEQKKILADSTLYFHKDPQLLDRKLLLKELEECRRTGFAQDHKTGHAMVKILAAPFFGPDGRPLGALQIIGFMEGPEIPTYGKKLVEVALRFSTMLRSGSASVIAA